MEDRAARRPYALLLFQLNIFLSPVLLVLISLSSLLSAPLLSLFTLPVFFLTFPRPARFWPGRVGGAAATSPDSAVYQQSCRPVLTALASAARNLRRVSKLLLD